MRLLGSIPSGTCTLTPRAGDGSQASRQVFLLCRPGFYRMVLRAAAGGWARLHVRLEGEPLVPRELCLSPCSAPGVRVSCRNIAEALVSKGLATVIRYRQDDDQRSSHYDELLAAEAR